MNMAHMRDNGQLHSFRKVEVFRIAYSISSLHKMLLIILGEIISNYTSLKARDTVSSRSQSGILGNNSLIILRALSWGGRLRLAILPSLAEVRWETLVDPLIDLDDGILEMRLRP